MQNAMLRRKLSPGMARSSYTVIRSEPGATPEQARDARARAWAFVFQCWQEKQEGGAATAPDDRKGLKHDPAKISISQ